VDADIDRTRPSVTGGVVAEVSAAAGFLTRLPVARPANRMTSGAAAFGIIGALLGATAAVVLFVVAAVAPLAAGLLAVAVLAAVSGTLHIDGLADTADALAVGDPTRAETARHDPRVGASGVVAIVVVVGLDATLLATLVAARDAAYAALACMVATSGSRALASALPVIAGERVRAGGSAAWFSAYTRPAAGLVALASAASVAVIAQLAAGSGALSLGLVIGLALAFVAAEWLIHQRGALDGDGIGAIVETGFAAILLATIVAASQGL
jgi:adenosylcobinamide-GDP ribazoletransferase